MKIGKGLLLFVAGLQAFSSLMLMVGSGPGTFESDTGVAWDTLSNQFPTVAYQFSMAQTASLVAYLSTDLLAIAILSFAFTRAQRWAWVAMWILPASILPGAISLARTENQWGVAVFAGMFILMAVLGLVFSYREVFAPAEQH